MELVLTLVLGAKRIVGCTIVLFCIALCACQSPLDLDVDRSKRFPGPPLHPTKLSILYYHDVADAYELVITDTNTLKQVNINAESSPVKLSFDQIIYRLPDSIPLNPRSIPFVRSFSLSATDIACDGVENDATGKNSWIMCEVLTGSESSLYTWPTDAASGNRIKQTFFTVPDRSVIKGTLLIYTAQQATPLNVLVYRALVTIEY